MRKFRLLTADEIECRIATCNENGLQLLLYKTARTDAALLDEVYPDAWQNDFKVIDGKMYGGIGIKVNSEWLWRWDCGTESNTEAEKGEASDAFKRAGFKWGIGAELYSSPFVWVNADACKLIETDRKDRYGKKVYECRDRFKVAGIDYDENEHISFLAIDNVSRHCAAYISDPKYVPKEERTEKPTKSDFADMSDIRMEILALANGDIAALSQVIEKITNGKFKSLDGMNMTELIAVKKIITNARKKNESKQAED